MLDQSKRVTPNHQNGFVEGIARSISQAAVFIIDTKKTHKQLYGNSSDPYGNGLVKIIRNGILTSIFTSGLVFGTYYRVYYGIGSEHWYAGPCAAVSTSVIKIPISNAMRCMQSGQATNIASAVHKLYRTKKLNGMYSGYGMSLMEDVIEFDMRARLYQLLRDNITPHDEKTCKTAIGGSLGAITGACTAWLTTPFDTVRTQMAVSTVHQNGIKVATKILKERGIQGLYAGALLRASASAVKSSIFFLCVEALQI